MCSSLHLGVPAIILPKKDMNPINDLYAAFKTEFIADTGLNATENPTAYVEYVKMKAQELIYREMYYMKQELQAIKAKIN